ncbi:hypothetical protein EON80_10255 [bacterium]|nr:MAG: hypothetical protein EON80_10255 [bacterium]
MPHLPRSQPFAALALLFALLSPAQAQPGENPIFSGDSLNIPPFELPAEVPPLVVPPRIPLQNGEIMVEGIVQSVSFAHQEMAVLVSSITLPSGQQSTLDVPTLKTIAFDPRQMSAAAPYPSDGSLPHWVSSSGIWPNYRVAVVGLDSGPGQPMRATFIELGSQLKKTLPSVLPTPPLTVFFNGVYEHVAATGLRVGPMFGITDIGGKANRGSSTSDHPRGLALDFMVGKNAKLGDTVAAYFESSAGLENVKYIIWKDHLVYPGARTDWAALPVDYGPGMTLRHMDHVHVSFQEKPLVAGPYLTDAMIGQVRLIPTKLTTAKLSSRVGKRKTQR